MPYEIESIRKKLQESTKGKSIDPDEFRPKKAESDTQAVKYRFFILPPFQTGDKIKGGKASRGMDQFFIHHGAHWIQQRPHACTRLFHEEECPICQFGFDLLKETKDEEKRKLIVRDWMPNSSYLVNIHFPSWVKTNPEELRGRTMFYNAPKTCFDLWVACAMRDESSEEDPEAYGAFFDEAAGFLFELNVIKKGKNNSYAASKFLANSGNPQPMVRDDNFKALLESRINLFEKMLKPDSIALKRIAQNLINGDSASLEESSGFDVDEDQTPAAKTKNSNKEFSSEEPFEESKPKSKKAQVIVDSDDEEEAPKAKKKEEKHTRKVEDDDDDESVERLLSQLEDDDE
jgi:hypothetical protein